MQLPRTKFRRVSIGSSLLHKLKVLSAWVPSLQKSLLRPTMCDQPARRLQQSLSANQHERSRQNGRPEHPAPRGIAEQPLQWDGH
jgi:hypothetical protein